MNQQRNAPLIEQFVQAFEETTHGQISGKRSFEIPDTEPGRSHRPDLLLRAKTSAGGLTLAVRMVQQGYPRDIRNATGLLEEYASRTAKTNTALFVLADNLSPGARAMLRARGIGYYDSSGTFFLQHGHWLIDVERASKPAARRKANSLFTDAREQVIHALLNAGDAWHAGLEIATLAKTSAYTVSLTMQELERLEWVESEGSGPTLRRRLSQPGKLLDAWAEVWKTRKDTRSRWYTYLGNTKNLASALSGRLARANPNACLFTGACAANLLTPLLTHVETADLIVAQGSSGSYAQALELKQADRGSNVVLIERSAASFLFSQQQPDSKLLLASPFIQYLDLLDGHGRNKELAEKLRAEILKI